MKTLLKTLVIMLLILGSPAAVSLGQDGDAPIQPLDPSQDIRFDHLTAEQGLSSNIAWGAVQDDYGFIWIGTLDGLNRYDGNTFKIYRYDPKDPTSLGDNSVRTLARDSAGNIWIGSWGGGLNKFDPSTEQFTRYKHDPSDPKSLGGNQVFTIHQDQAGVLWVGTAAGLDRLDPETNTFTHYRHDADEPGSLSHDGVRSVFGDPSGDLWVGTNGGGLNRLDPATGHFTHYRHDPADPHSLTSDRVASVFQDRSGSVWIGTFDRGLSRLGPESGLFTNFRHDPNDPNSLGADDIRTIYQDTQGVLWFGGGFGGVWRFDDETETFVHHQNDANDPSSLSHDAVAAISGGPDGTLWISTSGGGVSRMDPNRKPFAQYRHDPTNPGSLSNSDVRSMLVDHTGTLWLGTPLGFNRFNGPARAGSDSARFTRYLHDRSDPLGLNGVYAMTLAEDQAGALWVGTLTNGLLRFDRDSDSGIVAGQFTQYQNNPSDPTSLQPNLVRDLYVDSSGILWIGTLGGGLSWFDTETESFHRYQFDPANPNSLSDNSVMSILEDDSGELWIATMNGLNRFVPGSQEFVRYPHDPNDPDSLSHSNALELFLDREGVLWVGTNGGGLNRFNSEDESFVAYTKSDGLPSDMIAGITQDDEGSIWLSTSQGLSKFDSQSETFRNYDASDGLQGTQFNINSSAKGSRGELYFGGVKGFNGFHPTGINNNPTIPPVLVTDFRLANRPVEIGEDSVLKESILATEEVVLSHQDRVISFEFAALNYSSPQKNRYRYKLEGFDEEWTEVGSDRRFVTYTNLDPGDYVLRVLGSNNDGVWNEEGTSLAIRISPPWWQTGWFRGGAVLVLVGLVVGGFVWQRANARRRERQLQSQVAEQTQELGERVKELDCLYGISSLAAQAGISLDEILQGTVALLPPAWQHPEIACARLEVDGQEYVSEGFQDSDWRQSADIMVRGERAGEVEVFYLDSRPDADEGPFTAEERRLLITVAERVGLITERLLAESTLRRTHSELSTILTVSKEVVRTLDLDTLLEVILSEAERVITYDGAGIFTLAEETLDLRFYRGIELEADLTSLRFPIMAVTPFRELALNGQPFIYDDLHRDRDLASELLEASGLSLKKLFGPCHSWLSVPMIAGDGVLGFLTFLHQQPGYYQVEDQELASAFASQAAIAIVNARLYRQSQEVAVLEERTRLAGELHDSVTQSLYTASLIAETLPAAWQSHPEEALRTLEDLRGLTQGALAEMRTLLLELRPGALADRSLGELVRQLTEATSARTDLPISVTVTGDLPLPEPVKIVLYRITQEALNNIIKHARAERAWVNLRHESDRVRLRIADNGTGFDPASVPPDRMGLQIMRDRAEGIGAVLEVNSQPGEGTEIVVTWAADGGSGDE